MDTPKPLHLMQQTNLSSSSSSSSSVLGLGPQGVGAQQQVAASSQQRESSPPHHQQQPQQASNGDYPTYDLVASHSNGAGTFDAESYIAGELGTQSEDSIGKVLEALNSSWTPQGGHANSAAAPGGAHGASNNSRAPTSSSSDLPSTSSPSSSDPLFSLNDSPTEQVQRQVAANLRRFATSAGLINPKQEPQSPTASPGVDSNGTPSAGNSFEQSTPVFDVEIVSCSKLHERGLMILAPKVRYSRRSLNIELPIWVFKCNAGQWEDVTALFKGKFVSYLEDAKNTRHDQAHKEGKNARRGEFSSSSAHSLNAKVSHAGRWWLVLESEELCEVIDFELKTLTEPRGKKSKEASAQVGVPPPGTSATIASTIPQIASGLFPSNKRRRNDEGVAFLEDQWSTYFEGGDYIGLDRFLDFWETRDDSFQRNYRRVIEHYLPQPISKKHFLRFIACFGPMQGCAGRLMDLYKTEVFFNHGSVDAARKFLEVQAANHFFIRPSFDNQDDHHFVLAVKQPSSKTHCVTEYRIVRVQQGGASWLHLPKAMNPIDQNFRSFRELVEHFSSRWNWHPIYNPDLPTRIEETVSCYLAIDPAPGHHHHPGASLFPAQHAAFLSPVSLQQQQALLTHHHLQQQHSIPSSQLSSLGSYGFFHPPSSPGASQNPTSPTSLPARATVTSTSATTTPGSGAGVHPASVLLANQQQQQQQQLLQFPTSHLYLRS